MGCNDLSNDPSKPKKEMYFPPASSQDWETENISSLGWNEAAIPELRSFLKESNTKAFLLLVNGRIVLEEYYDGHRASDSWEWNSAGKTLVAATVSIAAQNELIQIDSKASDYLSTGWTNMPSEKEALITVKDLLSMTAGNDETRQLMIKQNITYVADAGTRWAYSNIFQKLMDIISVSTDGSYEAFFNKYLKEKIGMDGFWNTGVIFSIYHSTARSMARFGILAMNKGKWMNEQIIDEALFVQSISPSQNLNPSYGYLWWLNGRESYMLPSDRNVYSGMLVSNAPVDMFAAMGAFDQRLYIVPSKNLIVIRMGNASDPSNPVFAGSRFDNELWAKINLLIR